MHPAIRGFNLHVSGTSTFQSVSLQCSERVQILPLRSSAISVKVGCGKTLGVPKNCKSHSCSISTRFLQFSPPALWGCVCDVVISTRHRQPPPRGQTAPGSSPVPHLRLCPRVAVCSSECRQGRVASETFRQRHSLTRSHSAGTSATRHTSAGSGGASARSCCCATRSAPWLTPPQRGASSRAGYRASCAAISRCLCAGRGAR